MGTDLSLEKQKNDSVSNISECPFCGKLSQEGYCVDYISRYWYFTKRNIRTCIEITYMIKPDQETKEIRRKFIYDINKNDNDVPNWVKVTKWHRNELDEI